MKVNLIFSDELWHIVPHPSKDINHADISLVSYDEAAQCCKDNGWEIISTEGLDEDDDESSSDVAEALKSDSGESFADTVRGLVATIKRPDLPVFYAERLPEKWNDIEVSPVVRVDDAAVEVTDDESKADFWSVYLRSVDGTARCVADVSSKKEAEALAALLRAAAGSYEGPEPEKKSGYHHYFVQSENGKDVERWQGKHLLDGQLWAVDEYDESGSVMLADFVDEAEVGQVWVHEDGESTLTRVE